MQRRLKIGVIFIIVAMLSSGCIPYMDRYFNRVNLLMGNYYYNGGKPAAAMRYYESFLKSKAQGPERIEAKKRLLKIYISEAKKAKLQGDEIRAVEIYKKMLEYDFSSKAREYAVLNLGEIYDSRGWYDLSEKLYKRYYKEFKTERLLMRLYYVYLQKAKQYEKDKLYIDAKKYYNLALELHPDSKEAADGIERINRKGITIQDMLKVYFDNPARLGPWESAQLFDFFYARGELRLAKRLLNQLPRSKRYISSVKCEGVVFEKLNNKALLDIVYALKTKNYMWLATRNQGIFKYDLLRDKVKFFNFSEQFEHTISIRGLVWYLDYLFVATLRDGLLVFDSIVEKLDTARLATNYIASIKQVGDYIYIGSTNGKIYKYNIVKDKVEQKWLLPKRYKNPVMSIELYDNSLWAGTFKGLYRISLQSGNAVRIYSEAPVKSVAVYDNGIVFGTWGKGVYRVTDDGKTVKINSRVNYVNRVKSIGNYLYVCTNRTGLWRYDMRYDYWYRFGAKEGLADASVNEVFYDGKRLWVFGISGTSRSLITFDMK